MKLQLQMKGGNASLIVCRRQQINQQEGFARLLVNDLCGASSIVPVSDPRRRCHDNDAVIEMRVGIVRTTPDVESTCSEHRILNRFVAPVLIPQERIPSFCRCRLVS